MSTYASRKQSILHGHWYPHKCKHTFRHGTACTDVHRKNIHKSRYKTKMSSTLIKQKNKALGDSILDTNCLYHYGASSRLSALICPNSNLLTLYHICKLKCIVFQSIIIISIIIVVSVGYRVSGTPGQPQSSQDDMTLNSRCSHLYLSSVELKGLHYYS